MTLTQDDAPPVPLTLKIGNKFFCMTVWLMVLYHHTKFGYMICGSEDIRTNTLTLNLCYDLDLERSCSFSP